jgi:hypothetical protein
MNAAINNLPVEVLGRDQQKVDGSHDRMTFKMQSTTEQGKWERVFPNPTPATHYLHYEWNGNVLTVEPRVKPVLAEAEIPPDGKLTINGTSATDLLLRTPAPDAERLKLEALTEPQLLTLAAERGVAVEVDGKGKLKGTKAQLVAKILSHKPAPAGV